MAAFLIHMLKWALTLTLLYSLYGLLLRKETFHSFNRTVLCAILLLSFTLPFCRIETGRATPVSRHMARMETAVHGFMDTGGPRPMRHTAGNEGTPEAAFSFWPRLSAGIYAAGAAGCLAGYLFSLGMLARTIRQGKRLQVAGVPSGIRIVREKSLPASCSWMNWVLLDASTAARRGHPVLEHELAHVRMKHSWDMLFCELTARMLWFLPFAWMLRKDLRDVHEFQADRAVLRAGVEEETYQHLLIRHAAGRRALPAANSFDHSSVKKRLVMMCRRPSARTAALKAVYLLPLVLIAITSFARPAMVRDIRQVLEREESAAPLISPKALLESVAAATRAPGTKPPAPAAGEKAPLPPEETPQAADSLPAAADLPPVKDTAAAKAAAPPVPAPKTEKPQETCHVTLAPITPEEFWRMDRNFWIVQGDEETYVTYLWCVREKEEHIGIDGNRFYLLDMDSGDRYMCRRIEGYPDKKVDLKLQNLQRTVVEFTLVFPPLEESLKRIQLAHPQARSQMKFKKKHGYKLKEVLKQKYKVIQ